MKTKPFFLHPVLAGSLSVSAQVVYSGGFTVNLSVPNEAILSPAILVCDISSATDQIKTELKTGQAQFKLTSRELGPNTHMNMRVGMHCTAVIGNETKGCIVKGFNLEKTNYLTCMPIPISQIKEA